MSSLTQNNRLITIQTPLGKDVLVVRELEGEEALSQPFSFRLVMMSERNDISAEEVLGKAVTIKISNSGQNKPRCIHGHISRFSGLDTVEGEKRLYQAEVVPGLWFAGLGGQNRIFENKDFFDIIKAVLGDYKGVSLRKSLSGQHPVRRYCVQFEESDLAFVSRLMAEEGVHYYFEHSDGSHLMCLVDKASAFKPALAEPVEYTGDGSNPLKNCVNQWQRHYSYHTARVEYRDYMPFSASEWHRKKLVETSANPALTGDKPVLERYGRFHFEKQDDHTDKLSGDFTKVKTEVMQKALEGAFDQSSGQSACCEFYAGSRFELDHPIKSESGKYLLTRVQHLARDGNDQDTIYTNAFQCQPADVFAPPSPDHFRRVISHPQVARVTDVKAPGEPGADVYTQIRVQFPWKSDLKSCWLRVVQAYAGEGWGANFVPRVGQEVVVEYINGDPDRPIVTGSLYNSDNAGPGYSKTQVGWKSEWEGSKFNEIRLDDKKGAEEIYFEAGKDWNVQVHNNNTEQVGNNQKITVAQNRDIVVNKGNETKTIKQGTQTTTVQGEIMIESKRKITLKVGSSKLEMTPKGITLEATEICSSSAMDTKLQAGLTMGVTGGALTKVVGGLVKIN